MSVISAIRSQFSIGQQHSSAFSAQQGAAAKTSLGRNTGDGAGDEVFYAALNDSDTNFDLDMLEAGLEYEAYKDMEESDRENNR